MLTQPLLPYQSPAVDKFLERGSLLVTMDPGTGKTIVAIAAAEELIGRGEASTCLCIVPAALKYQWAQRIAQFTDLPSHEIKAGKELITVPEQPGCIVIDGSQKQRDDLYEAINQYTEYVILGYPNVLNDWSVIRSHYKWELVVLDEITAIKNPGSDITRAVRETFQVPWRLGLTGTPVENKPEELYSIMEWISPGYLGAPGIFDKAYVKRNNNGDVMRYKNLPVLHEQLQPVTYRKKRADPDVACYFPREDEDTWLVGMPAALREAYLALAADLLDHLRAVKRRGAFDIAAAYRGGKPDEGTAVGRIAARMQAMEMLTCHPALIALSALDYRNSEMARRNGGEKATWPGSRWCGEIMNSGIISAPLAMATPKLDYLTDRCHEITRDPDTKILVYTKYTRMLPLLTEALECNSISTVTYSGEMTAARKAGAIAAFTADPGIRVFLSSHAGAYGVDMHMASHLVNYDIPWSGGKFEQVNGRHVRASNTRPVTYLRHLLARDSLDERKLTQVRFKQRLAGAIVDGRGADHLGRIENDAGTLTEFLEDLIARRR